MSVKRRDIIRHLEKNGWYFQREGGNHTIYTNENGRSIAIKRHKIFDRITANLLCKQAGVPAIF
ncbi:MAG: type II toxin-antitoxin system HicA family toxin [Synergistaceae bacterium]|nr:type II toxin-antitoxin system HicA family toxin [Synergistaceae bacterium]